MTDEQINEAITQATRLWDYPYSNETKRMYNFCADLNAMHEAEKMLDFNQLRDMEDNVSFRFAVLPFHATAAQRAEAFLRALGKWEATTEESLAVQKEEQP